MGFDWNTCLIEGDILYNYMINNFESMFDGNKIKHFDIRDGLYKYITDNDKIRDEYGEDIQKQLIFWIRKEREENRLLDKSLWKPFRCPRNYNDIFYGYRKMFQYKHFIFQLAIEDSCGLYKCEICDLTTDEYCLHNSKHFKLALYGWREDNSDKLLPFNDNFILLTDYNMPENYWRRKKYYVD
jgi:hypothetical protein